MAAIGANCGIGPGDAVAAAHGITEVAPQAVTITKANCGIPLYQTEGGLTYPVGPDRMGDYVELALRSGARIIGACCGSTPDHIAAIREAVDTSPGGERPSFEEIQERLEASARTGRRRPSGAPAGLNRPRPIRGVLTWAGASHLADRPLRLADTCGRSPHGRSRQRILRGRGLAQRCAGDGRRR